jgi:hypothetical protein
MSGDLTSRKSNRTADYSMAYISVTELTSEVENNASKEQVHRHTLTGDRERVDGNEK